MSRDGGIDVSASIRLRDEEALRVVALRVVRDSSTADDLIQEAVMRATKQPLRSHTERSMRAFLFATVKNLAISELRRRQRARSECLDDDAALLDGQPEPLDELVRQEDVSALRALVATLSPFQRAVVDLVHEQGLTVASAAEVLETCPRAVRRALRRGMEHLRFAWQVREQQSAHPAALRSTPLRSTFAKGQAAPESRAERGVSPGSDSRRPIAVATPSRDVEHDQSRSA